MTDLSVASFNVKNLIRPDSEYYRFQSYTPEEYAWKRDWLADQVMSLDADVIGFQEIFDEDALGDVIDEASARAGALNAVALPDRDTRYRRKAIFRRITSGGYEGAALAVAPNAADDGTPGARRPGVAILSRPGFIGAPEIIQDLPEPLDIPFQTLRGLPDGDAGFFRLRRLSRPILKVRVPVAGHEVTVFNCHLKSKLGEYPVPAGAAFPSEADLTHFDPLGRAMGALRAATRRTAEAWVLRRAIVAELEAGRPVLALGDFNDSEHAVSAEIIAGERPFRNYAWMLRHDAERPTDRYSEAENVQITEAVDAMRLRSAEKLFVRKSLRDMVYTTAFGGVFESIDQIWMSRHFDSAFDDHLAEMTYFSVLNDHLTDGSHPEAPYNKLASDHGQIIAHLRFRN